MRLKCFKSLWYNCINLYIKFLYIKSLFNALNNKISIRANNYHNFEVVMNVNEFLGLSPNCNVT